MAEGAGLQGAAIVFAALAAPGCLACRPPAPLDDAERAELESIRGRLRAREVRIVAPLKSDWWNARMLLLALEEAHLDVFQSVADPRDGDVTLDLLPDAGRTRGGNLWGPLFSMLTLGIVPDVSDEGVSVPVRWTRADGAHRDDACAVESPRLFGWVAPFVAMDEDWRFGGCPRDGDPERRALLARLGLSLARGLDALVGETGAAEEAP